jgi:hypothetical protein
MWNWNSCEKVHSLFYMSFWVSALQILDSIDYSIIPVLF